MFNKYAVWLWPNSLQVEDMEEAAVRMNDAGMDCVFPLLGNPAPCDVKVSPEKIAEQLHILIDACHKHGIEVHGCFDELKYTNKAETLYQKRQDDSIGQVLCPANPLVRNEIVTQLKQYLNTFPFDGITLEDSYIYQDTAKYDPANSDKESYLSIPTCFCDYCKAHGPDDPAEFKSYKRESLTTLVREISLAVKQHSTSMKFSAACRNPYSVDFYERYKDKIPYYEGWKYCESKRGLSADWKAWFEKGLIDFVCPMSYLHDPYMVELQTLEAHSIIRNPESNVWMGLGVDSVTAEYNTSKNDAYRNTPGQLKVIMERLHSIGQRNFVFFSYSNDNFNNEMITTLADMKTQENK